MMIARRSLRLRQRELDHADLVERGQTRRSAQLHPDRGPDRVHPGPEQPDLHDPRPVPRRAEDATRSPNKVKTFNGWRDVNYKPAPGATPFPACWSDEFKTHRPRRRSAGASGSPGASAPGAAAERRAPARRSASATVVRWSHQGISLHDADLTAPAGRAVRASTFDNQDAVDAAQRRRSRTRRARSFKSDTFNGVATRQFHGHRRSTAGTYPFVCTVHPTMTGTLTATVMSPPVNGRRMRMEDDGPAGARTRDGGAATTRPVRAARRGRLGVGVGQGVHLARHHHLHARLPARSRVLPHGRSDGRPRRPRLVADQPLPAVERDPAVPGAGRRRRPVGAVASRAEPPAGPDRRLGRPGRDSQILYIGGIRREDRQRSTVYVARTVGTGNFDKWADGPTLPAPRANASVVYVAGQHLRHGRHRRVRCPDGHGLRPEPERADRFPR